MIDFEPARVTVRQLFEQSKKLEVPRYQRSYSWRDDNIDDFYNDFIKTSQDQLNFLGTLVFDASDKGSYFLIDGQQRIITLTILFAVIRDILREDIGTLGAVDLAAQVENVFIKSGAQFSIDAFEHKASFRLKSAKDVHDFFEAYVQIGGSNERQKATKNKLNPSSRNVRKAYDKFRQIIVSDKLNTQKNSEDKIKLLKRTIAQIEAVALIKIEIYNNDIAFAIFESHNAKGVDLLISDLVKNYFFSQLSGSEETKQKSMDAWDDMVSNLRDRGAIKIDQFLHYFSQSYEGRFPKYQLYRRLKTQIKDNPQGFLQTLISQSELLIMLKDATFSSTSFKESGKLNYSLDGIASFNTEQCYILLLSLFRNQRKVTPSMLRNTVELIEKFTFVYSIIAKGQANVLEKVYGKYAKGIQVLEKTKEPKEVEAQSGRLYSSLAKELSDALPSYEEFEARFVNLDYSAPIQKKTMNYIFDRMEHYESKGGTSLGIEISLDHIQPQSKPNGIKNINKIGNLVPVDRSTNSQLGNKLPSEKVDIYKKSKNIFAMQRLIEFGGDLKIFNDDKISERSKQLAAFAYNIVWSIPRR
jgi:uncharacterized protein with ParB-like and HNH nuclease domain